MIRDWSMPMDEADLALLTRTRAAFSAATAEIAAAGRASDAMQAAVARHLAAVTAAVLPPTARVIWSEKVARPLKCDPAKPLPERAINSIRSWPSSRAAELAASLAEVEAALLEMENDALHEAIYVEISRAYS